MATQELTDNKKKIDWALYWNDFNWKFLGLSLSLFIGVLFFYESIKRLFTSILVKPILEETSREWPIQLFLILVTTVALIIFAKRTIKPLLPSLNSIVLGIGVFACYFIFRFDRSFEFYHFTILKTPSVYFFDLVLLSVFLFSLTYKSYLIPKTIPANNLYWSEDAPAVDDYEDTYNRTPYAKVIAEHIKSTTTKTASFVIGIIAKWGMGKTDFLERIKKELKNPSEYILVDFNPWKVNKADAIVEDFFKSFSSRLKPFNRSIAKTLNDYSQKILKTGKEIHYRIFDTLINEFANDLPISEDHKIINESIKATGRRIVVFIDDIDRLTGKEIIEVIRLVRNSASFANTFFVLAFDQRYLIKCLIKSQDLAFEDEYLKKIFQLTLTLPEFKKNVFVAELKRLIRVDKFNEADIAKIDSALTELSIQEREFSLSLQELDEPAFGDGQIEGLLDNIRDMRKFYNSFKIAYNILKDEAEIKDLMVLELIRVKNLEVYEGVRSQRLLELNTEKLDTFKINEPAWEALEKEFSIPKGDSQLLHRAVQYLIHDDERKSIRRFSLTENSYLYSSYQLFEHISISEFNSTIAKDEFEIKSKFDTWISQGRNDELKSILADYNEFPSKVVLRKMVTVYLMMESKEQFWLLKVKEIIFDNLTSTINRYFNNNKSEFEEFLNGLLEDKRISLYNRALFAKSFLEGTLFSRNLDERFPFSKPQWQDIVLSLFQEFLASWSPSSGNAIPFYYLNVVGKSVAGVEILNRAASEAFRKHLFNNTEAFKDYTKYVVNSYHTPFSGFLNFEPRMNDIFGTVQVYVDHLEKTEMGGEMATLKQFILKYIKDNYGKKFFSTDGGEDYRFIERWLTDNGIIKNESATSTSAKEIEIVKSKGK